MKRNITYMPPDPGDIRQFAQQVCALLGETVDPAYASPTLSTELAEFLQVVAVAAARLKSKESDAAAPLDTPPNSK